MEFGLFVNTERQGVSFGTAWDEDLFELVLGDRLGIGEAWISEHGVTPELLISKAAAVTEHIKMGPGVRPLPFHHPLQIAIEANACDHLTNGRYLLGLGLGGPESGARAMEKRGLDDQFRREMLHESIDYIMTAFNADGPFDYEGEFWHGKEIELKPDSVQQPHVPVAISTTGTPSTMELAAKRGFLPIFGQYNTPEQIATASEVFVDESEKVGRQNSRADIRTCSYVYVAESTEQAKEHLREKMTMSIERQKKYFPHHFKNKLPPSGELEDVNFDYLVDAGHYFVGNPDTVYEYIKDYYDTAGGFGVFLLVAGKDFGTHEQRERSWQLIMEELAPRFRELDPDRAPAGLSVE